jgi:two-component system chemotaxis response regulator CheB
VTQDDARRVRVLIVDDAPTVRRLLTEVLSADPELQVIGAARDGREALARMGESKPDVVVLDVAMPEMDGLETLAEMRRRGLRIPVIMYSSLTRRGAAATLDALALGASDYVAKPSGAHLRASVEQARRDLTPRILALGRRAAGLRGKAVEREIPTAAATVVVPPAIPPARADIVAIGASTGGPNALAEILPALTPELPVPILIVQHMPPLFTRHLAERLDAKCALRVSEAATGVRPRPGEVWIAPGGHHMVLGRDEEGVRIRLHQGPPQHSCRPAVDELFGSVAEVCRAAVLAVLLTGMGQDGLAGCRRIRLGGGQILAQDETTSVVWGMPGRVVAAGLADAVLPLGALGGEIERRVQAQRKRRPSAA